MTPTLLKLNKRNHSPKISAVGLGCVGAICMLALGYGSRTSVGNHDRPDSPSPLTQSSTNRPGQQKASLSRDEKAPSDDIRKISFYRNGYIYIRDVAKGETRRIAEGADPDISPLGTAVAFTDVKLTDVGGGNRTIKVFDLKTGESRGFPSLAGIHCYAPKWSHDGTKLAFKMVLSNRTYIGILNVADGTFENVSRGVDADFLGGVSWADDDRSIIFHDLDNIYEVAVDGRLVQTIPIKTIVNQSDISTSTEFSFSPDKRYLLFDGHRGGPNGIIYLYDFQSRELSAITPETIGAREPVWAPSHKDLLFTCVIPDSHDVSFDICMKSIDGDEIRTIIKNASDVSYSTK